MTADDFKVFAGILGFVAVAASKELDGPTIDVFFKALGDIPLDLIRRASPIVIRDHTDRWPSIPIWRRCCDEVASKEASDLKQMQVDRARKLLPGVVDESGDYVPTFVCGLCRDTGWRPDCGCSVSNLYTVMDHPQSDLQKLGQCRRHGGREQNGTMYRRAFEPCDCRNDNPVYLATIPKVVRTYYSKKKPKEWD
jgi:hypothetical protein